MAFLNAFDQLNNAGLNEQASQLLYSWMLHREQALYAELRNRPVLPFWSLCPGNPDFLSHDPRAEDDERKPGWAYLLTSRADVEEALDRLSMRPYESWLRDTKMEAPWVLSMDDVQEHTTVWTAMHAAMHDPVRDQKMEAAVQLHWADAKADLSRIDVRHYFRRVALSFTGAYFGIPASFIFEEAPRGVLTEPPAADPSPSGIENLEQWSGEGYEDFIWKIHARHFDPKRPEAGRACLVKIGRLVGLMAMGKPMSGTVIERFTPRLVEIRWHFIRNIVGMIQGLVDNMMTSACIALNQIMTNDRVVDAANMDLDGLIGLLRTLQAAHEAPSPFLPRFGRPGGTTDGKGSIACGSLLDRYPELTGSNITCAIGAAMTDPASPPDAPDIRLGYGMHECIGRELGDRLVAYALQPLLRLQRLQTVKPLQKQWGWIPQQFVVAADHQQRRNQVLIEQIANAAPPRPNPYSQWSSRLVGVEDYASWPALTDRGWFSRHLPPADDRYGTFLETTAKASDVTRLFERPARSMVTGRSSLLFSFFAQWLTDSFLRTDPVDRRRTTSNHQLDLCQIYGLNDQTTRILRSGLDGQMRMEAGPDGGMYPPRLFDAPGKVKLAFQGLPYIANGQLAAIIKEFGSSDDAIPFLCASGLERGNSTVGYSALNTLFLREHNRICGVLKAGEGAGWDDERLFQTARMVMILIEIKIIIEDYINHINIAPAGGRPFRFDPDYLFAERRRWYRTNWISVEFDLLYRWHSLVPDEMTFAGTKYASKTLRGDNRPLFAGGLGRLFFDASANAAGTVRLHNTPDFLMRAEQAAVEMARGAKLQPFNAYRQRFGIPPMKDFDEFYDADAQAELQRIYGHIDKVEFLPGIMAEQPDARSSSALFGLTMMAMVGYDAFTHALTNPLLSENVLTAKHLTRAGLDIVMETSTLEQLLHRNTTEQAVASFDLPGAVRASD